MKEDSNSQDQARNLGSEKVLEWEVNVCHQIAECSLLLLKISEAWCIKVWLNISSEPTDEYQTTHEQNGICKVKNDWELVEPSQSFGKDEGNKVLQKEGEVEEAQQLNSVESLVKVADLWSNMSVCISDWF